MPFNPFRKKLDAPAPEKPRSKGRDRDIDDIIAELESGGGDGLSAEDLARLAKLQQDLQRHEKAAMLYTAAARRYVSKEMWSQADRMLGRAGGIAHAPSFDRAIIALQVAMGQSDWSRACRYVDEAGELLSPSDGESIEQMIAVIDDDFVADHTVELTLARVLNALGRPDRGAQRLRMTADRLRAAGQADRLAVVEAAVQQFASAEAPAALASGPSFLSVGKDTEEATVWSRIAASRAKDEQAAPAADSVPTPPAAVHLSPEAPAAPPAIDLPAAPPEFGAGLDLGSVHWPDLPPLPEFPDGDAALPLPEFPDAAEPAPLPDMPALPAVMPVPSAPEPVVMADAGILVEPPPAPVAAAVEPGPGVEPEEEVRPAGAFVRVSDLLSAPEEGQPADPRFVGADRRDEIDSEEEQFRDLVRQLRSELANAIAPGDAQAHYDLGQTWLDMELYDEAVEAFQMARRHPGFRDRSTEGLLRAMLGRGDAALAYRIAATMLAEAAGPEEDSLGLLYLQGRAAEQMGRREEAADLYERVCIVDITYEDARGRLAALSLPEATGR
jgi:hypothetical protein